MNKTCRLVELRPDRFLLDDSFDGYKLSLDPIPIYRHKIETGVLVRQQNDDQYSFCHAKLFSLHNHFHYNPQRPGRVYYVDKNLSVFKVTLSTSTQNRIVVMKVCDIPKNQIQSSGCYNISIAFPSSEFAVVSDGKGVAYLVKILETNNTEIWGISKCLLTEEFGFILTDAKFEGEDILNLLIMYVEEKAEKDDSKESNFQTVIKWKKLLKEDGQVDKVLTVNGSVDYLVFEPDCKSIYVISDNSPKWLFDSENPILTENDNKVAEPVQKMYTWTQTRDEITLWLPIPEEMTKSDFDIQVNDLSIEIKSKGVLMLEGEFYHRVDKSLTSWNFTKQQIEIQLAKQEDGLMWETLLKNDDRGEEIVDPEVVKSVHSKLAHLCSTEEERGSFQSTLNSQQLEECDASSPSSSLFRIEETHKITHEVTLSSSQWLFKVQATSDEPPAICCRHDVDACVWQFSKPKSDSTWDHKHIGTFSAFGYVQASKNQKKFMASSPDLSFVVVCDVSHRIYIYRQQSPVTGELKNRLTGKKVKTMSKQQLVNLETTEHILGLQATNSLLYVLQENTICVLVINE